MLPERRLARSRLGVAARKAKAEPTPENLELVERTKRDYAAAALAEHIRRVVDAAPPLTTEQRDRLASLFRSAT